ncbi:uncharacterized protein LOC132743153 [Ruditapes philippinarum]|uniref:uncharacterized protein LOC132743153 n=1 Tax=Ruditapes philippinarum TaxID=129788 RepID=UPI00295B46C9|nr:uncharacterized protein LOC132743153 [Ruditapes philippinarum]
MGSFQRLLNTMDKVSEQLALLIARSEPGQTPLAYRPPGQVKQSQVSPPPGFNNDQYTGRGFEPLPKEVEYSSSTHNESVYPGQTSPKSLTGTCTLPPPPGFEPLSKVVEYPSSTQNICPINDSKICAESAHEQGTQVQEQMQTKEYPTSSLTNERTFQSHDNKNKKSLLTLPLPLPQDNQSHLLEVSNSDVGVTILSSPPFTKLFSPPFSFGYLYGGPKKVTSHINSVGSAQAVGTRVMHSRDPTICEDELVFLRGFDHRAGLEPFRSISYYQVTCPDRISQCLHYTALKNLISCLDTTCREKLIHLYDYRLPDGSAPPKGHPGLDVSMRNNLVFANIDESPSGVLENTEQKLREFLEQNMKIAKEQVERMAFERDHEGGGLNVLAWNVNGLTNVKKECQGFVDIIDKNDVIFLFEAWTNSKSIVDIEGYVSYNFYRKYQHRNAKRCSGGVVIYVKDNLKKGISVVRNNHDSVIWLKIDKFFFNIENDIYLCGVYIWPEGSPFYNVCNVDLFDEIQNDIFEFENEGSVFLIGDWNSRVGLKADYIICDTAIKSIDNDDYIPDISSVRASCDKTCNSNGIKLLDLCKSTCCRIANGRISNDYGIGAFTFASRQGASLIDYLLAKERDFVNISDFKVHDFNEWSDHCPISVTLNCNAMPEEVNNSGFMKIRWSDEFKSEFRSGIIGCLPQFNRLTEDMYIQDRASVNNILNEFTDTVRQVADPLFTRYVSNRRDVHFVDNRTNDKEWFDLECKHARQRYIEAQRVFKRCNSEYSREQFLMLKSRYKQIVKKKKKIFEIEKGSDIENLRFRRPKDFWNYFKAKKKE